MWRRRRMSRAGVPLALLTVGLSFWLAACTGGGSTPATPTPAAGSGATDCPAPAAGTWLRVAGTANEVFNTSLVAAADCGYLSAGYVGGEKTDLALAKLDSSGGPVWAKQYTSDRDRRSIIDRLHSLTGAPFYWVNAIPLAGGGAAMISDALLLVVDKDGNPAWSTQYQAPGSTWHNVAFTSLVKVDGGFILQGHKKGVRPLADVVLAKVDDRGGVVWAREYPEMMSSWNAPLLKTADGHLIIGGWVDAGEGATKGAVARLSMSGEVEWLRTVQMDGWRGEGIAQSFVGTSSDFQTIALAANGDIILVQDCGIGPGGFAVGALISRLAPDGSHLWSKQFHWSRVAGNSHTWITQVGADGDDLLLTGSSTGFQYPMGAVGVNYNAYLARLNAYGDPIWIRSFGRTSVEGVQASGFFSDYGTSFMTTPDKRLLFTGYTNSFAPKEASPSYGDTSHYDAFVGLANSDGMVNGISGLTNTPDLGDKTEVWSVSVNSVGGSAPLTSAVLQLSVEDVTYTASNAEVTERTLPSDGTTPLTLTYKANEKELVSNVSMFQDTGDIDGDGIRQEWENRAAEILNPIFELDEKEDWLLNRRPNHLVVRLTPWHQVVNFTRVTPWPATGSPRYILLIYGVTWSADYGGGNTGITLLTKENHRGDVEKVVIALRLIGDRRAKLEWVSTSAHGDLNSHSGVWSADDRTCNLGKIANTSSEPAGTELMCAKLQFNSKGQLLLQASEDKHAIYPNTDVCESVRLVDWPVEDIKEFGEDCGWQPQSANPLVPDRWKESDFTDDSRYRGLGRWQFDVYNVGEPDHHLIDALGQPDLWEGLTSDQVASLTGLFPGETIWTGWTQHNDSHSGFCGGLGESDLLDWLNNPEACVGHSVAASLEPTQELIDALQSGYRVAITTASKAGAGTDAAVGVFLHGPRGVTGWTVLGSFEKGDTDVLAMGTHDVGPIATVVLSHDGAGEDPPWLVTKVTVLRKMTGEEWAWTSPDGIWVRGADVELTLTPQ